MNRISGLGRHYLRERPGRAFLVTFSVVLGVTVVVAVGAGTATLDRGINRFGTSIANADVIATNAGAFGSRLSSSAPTDLAALDGVQVAAPVTANTDAVAISTRPNVHMAATLLGIPLDHIDFLVSRPSEGRAPQTPDEVDISSGVAGSLHAAVGDRIAIGTSQYRVAGLLPPGTTDVAGTDAVIVGAPELTGPVDPSLVLVKLTPGTEASAWIVAHSSVLPNLALDDGSALRSSLRDLFSVMNVGFGSMSFLALGLATFLIYLALTASVAQRARDYGVLFSLGASRRQVIATVVGEALVIGVTGSIVGTIVGVVGARLFSSAITTIFGLPDFGLVLPPVTVGLGVVVGVGASVVAALVPAARAARVAPIAAIREITIEQPVRRWRLPAGVALVAVGMVLDLTMSASAFNPGALFVLIGLPMVLPALVPVFTRAVRPLLHRLAPGAGDLALAHLDEERHRLSLTAGLVTAALTMVVLTGAGYQSTAPQMRRFVQLQFGSDLQVFTSTRLGATSLPAGYVDQVRGIPGVRAVTPLWHAETRIAGTDRSRTLTVIDPSTYFNAAGYSFVDGDQAQAVARLSAGGAVLVNKPIATERGLHLGDPIDLVVGGHTVKLTIAATYAAVGDDFSRAFVIGPSDGERLLHIGNPNEVRVALTPGVDAHAVSRQLPPLGTEFTVRFGADNVDNAMRQFNGVFSMFLVIMAIAGLVGLLGVANTMTISVLQRSRQIGMLRAVGTRRREVRNMVLGEAILLVGVAFAVAVPIAAVLSISSSTAASTVFGFKPSTHFPWTWLPPILIATVSAGVLAGLLPARRATRLDPITALRAE